MNILEILGSSFIEVILGSFLSYVVYTSKKIQTNSRKLKVFLQNKQTRWSVSARFEKEDRSYFKNLTFQDIKLLFIKDVTETLNSKRDCVIDIDTKNKFVYNCSGLTFEITYSYDHIFMQMREYHAPYRDSLKLISKKMIPILRKLKEEIEKNERGSRILIGYSGKIRFEEANPFLGEYLVKANDLELKAFTCTLKEKEGGSVLKVNADNLEFQSCDLATLKSLIDEHLSYI